MSPFPAALDAVRRGEVAGAVVAFENSVEGAVPATLDDLSTEEPPLHIVREILLPVEFALMGRPGTALADIKTVSSHPHAYPQCRRWLAENLPDARWVAASSNADAARLVSEGVHDAALAGVLRGAVLPAHAAGREHPRRQRRGHPVRDGRAAGPAAGPDRRRQDVARGRAAGQPSRGAAGDPRGVRGPRRGPDAHRVPAHAVEAGNLLVLHRLRGAPRRRARRRGADRPAAGRRRGPVPRQLSARRRAAAEIRKGTSDEDFREAAEWLAGLRSR